jgi:O-antigen/teichoic acid export membrane protein
VYKSKFVRNVAIVATGTAAAQIVSMAFAPLVTRLYGPNAFGFLGTFMAFVNILTPVAALSFPIAIVLPKEDSDAKELVRLSLVTAAGLASILGLALLFIGERIGGYLRIEDIGGYIWQIPFVVLFAATHQVVQQWLIRTKQFGVTARVGVMQAFLMGGAKVGIGWFFPTASVLIVLTTVGSALHAGLLALGLKRVEPANDKCDKQFFLKTSMLELARRYYDFPLYRTPQVFINAASQSVPVLLLSAFFGPASAGFYTLGKTVLAVPSTLIGKSVGDVFYPRITEAAHRRERLTPLIFKATFALGVVGFVPFFSVVIFGPWLFRFVFGEEWVVAGEYARWMSLWLYFMFLNNPSTKALPILSAQGFHLIFTIFTIGIRLSVILFGYYYYNSDIIAILLFGIAGALINLVLIIIILYKCRVYDNKIEELVHG